MLLPPHTHVSTLLQLLIQRYFAQLTSVLIVHDGVRENGVGTALQQEYLEAVQLAFRNLSQQGHLIGLQWIDVSQLNRRSNSSGSSSSSSCIGSKAQNVSRSNSKCTGTNNDDGDDYDDELELHLLRAVNHVTEGFITILPGNVRFLHARYYATRNADLRLKDKFYLFLCEHENPADLLSTEILQFYPHHLMVTPEIPTAVQSANKQRKTEKSLKTPALSPSMSNIVTSPLLPAAYRNNSIQLWTQKYIGTNGNLNVLLLDVFWPNETFARNVELFPNKLNNMEGRTIHVGTTTYIPYVVSNYVPPGTGNVDALDSNEFNRTVLFIGSEAEILTTFCDFRNCHLRVRPYGADNWGYIYENQSSVGMLGDLYIQDFEVAIGCIYNWYNSITEVSYTIARSSVAVLGPAPALFPAWRANIIPFSSSLWIFIMFTILLCAFVMYFIRLISFTMKNRRKNQVRNFPHKSAFGHALLDMFAVFIQQPSGPTSLRTFAGRFFLATILCATITLENTYSGQLKSILTVPLFSEAVDTIEKWSKTDWPWSTPSIIWIQSVENSNIEKERVMAKKFVVHDYDFLYNASFRSDYGLGIERLMSGAFTFGKYITIPALETRIVTKDDLYFDWTRAVAIKGWPLMPLFDKHLLAFLEAGLYVYWERQVTPKYLDRKTQEIIMN
ncbi:PREDICTED: uncharacterized protein LOC108377379, partial [Rhagoletis zephyria]|uniref:uncharacterized protein LOC108377379 n=1 Tax=Rhagoletis zephyria TaxID=28612 RepID=UPI000811706F